MFNLAYCFVVFTSRAVNLAQTCMHHQMPELISERTFRETFYGQAHKQVTFFPPPPQGNNMINSLHVFELITHKFPHSIWVPDSITLFLFSVRPSGARPTDIPDQLLAKINRRNGHKWPEGGENGNGIAHDHRLLLFRYVPPLQLGK